MDPQQTWDLLLKAWTLRQWSEVAELSQALLEWLGRHGFPPETSYPKELGAEWDMVVATAACRFALQRSQQVLCDAHGIPADVPFVLICATCLSVGPSCLAEAVQEGWINIQYYPAGKAENFLGYCRRCRDSD